MDYARAEHARWQLKDTTSWMRQRQRRNAPYAVVAIQWKDDFDHQNIGFPTKDNPDALAAFLFDKSLLDYRVLYIEHKNQLIEIYLSKECGMDIDAEVVETICSWFDKGRDER